MASQSRDGFGWEYYVGKYDGLGRRRRRWVRTLRRVSSSVPVSSVAAKKKLMDAKKQKESSTTLTSKESVAKTHHPNVFRAIRDQYNFKGFGWTFYKSFLFARSFGAAFRIPLSANFDFYDRHLAAPYISSSTYFGYPWVVATFLNASIPKEAIVRLMDGVLWKIRWGLALVSALIRSVVETVIWMVLGPWRLWRASVQTMGILVSRVPQTREDDIANSSVDGVVDQAVDTDATNAMIDYGEGTSVSIETHIEINNSSECVSATAVADSPRGGASNNTSTRVSSFRKKHLTISGHEIPTFHRPTSLEYSSTIQERIGVCVSWRVSQERGYEFRWNFVYTFLPTFIFWRQLEEERNRRLGSVRRFMGVWGKRNDPSSAKYVGTIEVDKIQDKDDSRSESKSISSSRSKSSSKTPTVPSFWSEHSSTLGMGSGWPLPIDPYFSFNLMLVLSSFYYGWLLKYIRSLFVALPTPQTRSKDKELGQNNATISSTDNDGLSPSSQKLVSRALKKKLPLGDTGDLVEFGDEASITNSTQVDLGSDLENCTGAELNVAGF